MKEAQDEEERKQRDKEVKESESNKDEDDEDQDDEEDNAIPDVEVSIYIFKLISYFNKILQKFVRVCDVYIFSDVC